MPMFSITQQRGGFFFLVGSSGGKNRDSFFITSFKSSWVVSPWWVGEKRGRISCVLKKEGTNSVDGEWCRGGKKVILNYGGHSGNSVLDFYRTLESKSVDLESEMQIVRSQSWLFLDNSIREFLLK